jgi:hypothetical protein
MASNDQQGSLDLLVRKTTHCRYRKPDFSPIASCWNKALPLGLLLSGTWRKRTRAIPYLEIPLRHLLVCAVPNPGHVGPMLAVAQHLRPAL